MRAVACFVLVALTAGCQYGPLEHTENQPQISDAFIEREFSVAGEMWVRYRENNNNEAGDVICVVEQEIEGWSADELNDSTCVGCEETYTLAMRVTDDDGCDFGGPPSVDVAFTPVEFIDQYTDSNYVRGYVYDNEAEFLFNTTRNPREATGWTPTMAVFDGEGPFSPNGDGAWDCGRRWCASTWFIYGSSDHYASWYMALDFE